MTDLVKNKARGDDAPDVLAWVGLKFDYGFWHIAPMSEGKVLMHV